MGLFPTTITTRCSISIIFVASLIAIVCGNALAASQSSADELSVADAARLLAKDTKRLSDARSDLLQARNERLSVSNKQHRLRRQIEVRLVEIYKYGGSTTSVAQAAASGGIKEMSSSLDALDVVAKNDKEALSRWTRLVNRSQELAKEEVKLSKVIAQSESSVKQGRIRLSKAEARAAAEQAEAIRMARIADSPLLPRVVNPETTTASTDQGSGGDSLSMSSQPVGYMQSGIASMYADSFSGERTANGEKYDPNAFTAAHPSLPLGTWVTVTGPSGSVAVRINDRGPFVGGRIIDLSRAAAEASGVIGIAKVAISVQA